MSYRQGTVEKTYTPRKWGKPPRADMPPVQHVVQYSRDLHYPSYHEQGYGFEPSMSEVASHVLLESAKPADSQLPPTKQSGALA